jgi:hypothetical protein
MLAIIIVVITAMAILSVAFSSHLSMLNSSNQMIKTIDERRLLNDWALSIQQSMRPFGIDRGLLVPNGQLVDENDYLIPPSSINLQSKNAWNKDIIYCPYSINKSGGSTNMKAGDGESYDADIVTGVDGLEYVYSVSSSADPTGTDLIASIISPIPSSTSPSCNDIRFDSVAGDYYVVNYDGIVYPITYNALVVSNQAKSVRLTSDDESDFEEKSLDWSSVLPDVYNVFVEAGAVSINSKNINFTNDKASKSKSIIIQGEGVTQSFLYSSNSELYFENVTVKISDLTLPSGLKVDFVNSDVTLENVVINNVTFEGSTVYSSGNVSLVSNTSPVKFLGTKFTGSNSSLSITKNHSGVGLSLLGSTLMTNSLYVRNLENNGVGIIVGDASSLSVSSDITSDGSYLDSLLSVTSGGNVNLDNVLIEVATGVDTFMFNQGNVSLSNSSVYFYSGVINGIILGLNSDTVLNNFNLASSGDRPSTGIIDIGGAKFVAGFNSNIGASSECWSGDIFDGVAPSSTGSSSEPLLDSNKNSNRSVWTCGN